MYEEGGVPGRSSTLFVVNSSVTILSCIVIVVPFLSLLHDLYDLWRRLSSTKLSSYDLPREKINLQSTVGRTSHKLVSEQDRLRTS